MDEAKKRWLFPSNREEAEQAQKEMAQLVSLKDSFIHPITHIAGVDVSNTPFDPQQMLFSSTVLLSYPELQVVETVMKEGKEAFPYIPGLLGFREVPLLVETFRQLTVRPSIIMVDGHGISHPRGLGIATHLGLILDIPTIGVAKSILVGRPAGPLAEEEGSQVPLVWKQREIGMVIWTKKRCNPLIISAGHKVSLQTAIDLVLSCIKKYRLPETTRRAHLAANMCRKNYLNQGVIV